MCMAIDDAPVSYKRDNKLHCFANETHYAIFLYRNVFIYSYLLSHNYLSSIDRAVFIAVFIEHAITTVQRLHNCSLVIKVTKPDRNSTY